MAPTKSQEAQSRTSRKCHALLIVTILANLVGLTFAADPPATRPAAETDVHELRATIFNENVMIGFLRFRLDQVKKELAAAHGQTLPEPDVTLTVKPYPDLPVDAGWEYKKVAYRYSGINPHVVAEVTNHTGKNHGLATFDVSVFDKDGKFVGMMAVAIANFADGQAKPLNAPSIDVPLDSAATVKIKFMGSSE
jgi:hypothetical protein